MSRRSQSIRPSQFIFNYGPGSIVETGYGPRTVISADRGLFINGLQPEDFEISDSRLSNGLLRNARIFRLPSNAELGRVESYAIYQTRQFPWWRLCLNKRGHNGRFDVLYQGGDCPVCHQNPGHNNHEAIRFIVACPRGHMDDLPWSSFAHGQAAECRHQHWFMWFGGGGSMGDIRIECPECHSQSQNLGQAYSRPWMCTGRFPENEIGGELPNRPANCSARAKIVQRQASNLRIPEIKALFSIPPRSTKLHLLLAAQHVDTIVKGFGKQVTSKEQFSALLNQLVQSRLIPAHLRDEILNHEWDEMAQAIRDNCQDSPSSYEQLLGEELEQLTKAAVEGAPPLTGMQRDSPTIFEVRKSEIRMFRVGKYTFRVAPISRLRSVTVQTGYRREVDTSNPAVTVDIGFSTLSDPHKKWYPGIEFLGEGIFITLTEDSESEIDGQAKQAWDEVKSLQASYPEYVFRDAVARNELSPAFVWWHTLSHQLIRIISEDSGYSSAAMRERVYLGPEGKITNGGILLYSTQPGSEGTLGGLIALVPKFDVLLSKAFNLVCTCSSDPLCSDHKISSRSSNGASCYGCILLSETSCEHRNMWLDRNLLKENLP